MKPLLVHSGCLLLPAVARITNFAWMYIIFKYLSVKCAKLASFKGCIVDTIYYYGCENMLANFTSTVQEQPGFIHSV